MEQHVNPMFLSWIPRLCVEANELPLCLRREKFSLQLAFKLALNPNNPVYEAF